jgi:hypothetical protein
MAMLSKQDHGRSRVAGSTHEILGLDPFWLEWLILKLISDLNLRLGEETMGQHVEYHWMGRMRVDKRYSGLRGGSPCLCRLRTDRQAPVSKFELCTATCRIYGVS